MSKHRDIQWPPLGVADLKPDELVTQCNINLGIMARALSKALPAKSPFVNCRICGKLVDVKAKKCPHCGA